MAEVEFETYPDYLARKGDPAKVEPPVVTELYPDYLARKAREAEAAKPSGKRAKDVEDKAVKAEDTEGK